MSFLNKVNHLKSVEYETSIKRQLGSVGQDCIGGIFSTFTHSWLICGETIFIINNDDGTLLSSWTFGENTTEQVDITCVIELPFEGCSLPLLLIGTCSENVNQICFFNPNTRKIIRAININQQVRSLCIIEDGLNEVNPLNNALTKTQGLFAVGCADGSVLLLDLCRSILLKALSGDFKFISDEENAIELMCMHVNAITAPSVEHKLKDCYNKNKNFAVLLAGDCDDGVTALCYSLESAILFVGTSYGSFILWNMSTLTSIFTSQKNGKPVISLSLLEPCDDPRHNLYLWICYDNHPRLVMYCLSFASKYFVPGYGVYYQGFESTGQAYRFSIGKDEDQTSGKPISSQAVVKTVSKNPSKILATPDSDSYQLRIFLTFYEKYDRGQTEYQALIFDLNQWYKEQMPYEGLSPCIDIVPLDSTSLWHLALVPSSLTHYQSIRPLEQHFHPSSFDFKMWTLEEEGICCFEKLGLQSQWLRNMMVIGPSSLLTPTLIFQGALSAGLFPIFSEPPYTDLTTMEEERMFILTVCVENHLESFIENCASAWAIAGHPVAGCTLQFIVSWLWELHVAYKNQGNKICVPLFDQSGLSFDVNEKQALQLCKSLLRTVETLYTLILRKYGSYVSVDGLEQKLAAMALLRFYFDCCLKLISAKLLPEPNEYGNPQDSVMYKFNEIAAFVNSKRKEGPFLGDSLVGETGAESQWEDEGGNGRYPPPSIQSVLRYCLHPAPPTQNKLSLILYLYIDILNAHQPIRSLTHFDEVINFQYLFRIPDVQYKIVLSFWLLDHSLFDEGIEGLLDRTVLSADLKDDQHRSILSLLFLQGQEKLALQYLRLKAPPLHQPNDIRMELELLLSNKLINEAFMFQRKHSELREALLIQFFKGCIDKKLLSLVFGLHLDPKEESILLKFLKTSDLKEKGDLQVLLLLSRAKYSEAISLNDRLNSAISGPKHQLGMVTRDLIVRGVTSSLNPISRKLEFEMKKYRPPPPGTCPKPLSALIKIRNEPDGPLCQADSQVIVSEAAKSVRHLSDFVNSDVGKRKRDYISDDEAMEIDFEVRPRKRVPTWNLDKNIAKPFTSYIGGDLPSTPPRSDIGGLEREVMELVGTPLVRKREKKFSPGARPLSILKGRTPEKGVILDEQDDTPRKTLRFALPENKKPVAGRRSLRLANIQNRSNLEKMDVSEDKKAKEDSSQEPTKPAESLSVRQTVDWKNVAEAAKPKVLFSQGSGPTKPPKKLLQTPPHTLLDISVSSAERKYLESPSRESEMSPVTEAVFNMTVPKKLFCVEEHQRSIESEIERIQERSKEAFIEKYKRLRLKSLFHNEDPSCSDGDEVPTNNDFNETSNEAFPQEPTFSYSGKLKEAKHNKHSNKPLRDDKVIISSKNNLEKDKNLVDNNIEENITNSNIATKGSEVKEAPANDSDFGEVKETPRDDNEQPHVKETYKVDNELEIEESSEDEDQKPALKETYKGDDEELEIEEASEYDNEKPEVNEVSEDEESEANEASEDNDEDSEEEEVYEEDDEELEVNEASDDEEPEVKDASSDNDDEELEIKELSDDDEEPEVKNASDFDEVKEEESNSLLISSVISLNASSLDFESDHSSVDPLKLPDIENSSDAQESEIHKKTKRMDPDKKNMPVKSTEIACIELSSSDEESSYEKDVDSFDESSNESTGSGSASTANGEVHNHQSNDSEDVTEGKEEMNDAINSTPEAERSSDLDDNVNSVSSFDMQQLSEKGKDKSDEQICHQSNKSVRENISTCSKSDKESTIDKQTADSKKNKQDKQTKQKTRKTVKQTAIMSDAESNRSMSESSNEKGDRNAETNEDVISESSSIQDNHIENADNEDYDNCDDANDSSIEPPEGVLTVARDRSRDRSLGEDEDDDGVLNDVSDSSIDDNDDGDGNDNGGNGDDNNTVNLDDFDDLDVSSDDSPEIFLRRGRERIRFFEPYDDEDSIVFKRVEVASKYIQKCEKEVRSDKLLNCKIKIDSVVSLALTPHEPNEQSTHVEEGHNVVSHVKNKSSSDCAKEEVPHKDDESTEKNECLTASGWSAHSETTREKDEGSSSQLIHEVCSGSQKKIEGGREDVYKSLTTTEDIGKALIIKLENETYTIHNPDHNDDSPLSSEIKNTSRSRLYETENIAERIVEKSVVDKTLSKKEVPDKQKSLQSNKTEEHNVDSPQENQGEKVIPSITLSKEEFDQLEPLESAIIEEHNVDSSDRLIHKNVYESEVNETENIQDSANQPSNENKNQKSLIDENQGVKVIPGVTLSQDKFDELVSESTATADHNIDSFQRIISNDTSNSEINEAKNTQDSMSHTLSKYTSHKKLGDSNETNISEVSSTNEIQSSDKNVIIKLKDSEKRNDRFSTADLASSHITNTSVNDSGIKSTNKVGDSEKHSDVPLKDLKDNFSGCSTETISKVDTSVSKNQELDTSVLKDKTCASHLSSVLEPSERECIPKTSSDNKNDIIMEDNKKSINHLETYSVNNQAPSESLESPNEKSMPNIGTSKIQNNSNETTLVDILKNTYQCEPTNNNRVSKETAVDDKTNAFRSECFGTTNSELKGSSVNILDSHVDNKKLKEEPLAQSAVDSKELKSINDGKTASSQEQVVGTIKVETPIPQKENSSPYQPNKTSFNVPIIKNEHKGQQDIKSTSDLPIFDTFQNNAGEKAFFFGNNDSETYLRASKATFQVGSRPSLPNEDETINPMEVAMIEELEDDEVAEDEESDPRNTGMLNVSDEDTVQNDGPEKVDRSILTTDSYMQRKLRRSSRKAEANLIKENVSSEALVKGKVNKHNETASYKNQNKQSLSTPETSGNTLQKVENKESETVSSVSSLSDVKLCSQQQPLPSNMSDMIVDKKSNKNEQHEEIEDSSIQKSTSRKSSRSSELKGILKNKSKNISSDCAKDLRVQTTGSSDGSSQTQSDADAIVKTRAQRTSFRKTVEDKGARTDPYEVLENIHKIQSQKDSGSLQNSEDVTDLRIMPDNEDSKCSQLSKNVELSGILKKVSAYDETRKLKTTSRNLPAVETCKEKTPAPPEILNLALIESVAQEKKRRQHSSKVELDPESAENSEIHKQSSSSRSSASTELKGILKKPGHRSSQRSSTSETSYDLRRRLQEDFPIEEKRSRRYSEEPDLHSVKRRKDDLLTRKRRGSEVAQELSTHFKETIEKKRKEQGSSSSSSDPAADLRVRIEIDSKDVPVKSRRHSDLPTIHGILKNKDTSKELRSTQTSQTLTDSINRLTENVPAEKKRTRRGSVDIHSSENVVKSEVRERKTRRHSFSSGSNENIDLKENTCEWNLKRSDQLSVDSLTEKVLKTIDKERQSTSKPSIITENPLETRSMSKRQRHSISAGLPEEPRTKQKRSSLASNVSSHSELDVSPNVLKDNVRRSSRRRSISCSDDTDKTTLSSSQKAEDTNQSSKGSDLDLPSDLPTVQQRKSKSLQDFPIRRSTRRLHTVLEDIKEEEEASPRKKLRSLDDLAIVGRQSKSKSLSKTRDEPKSFSSLVLADTDSDSETTPIKDVWNPEGYTKERRLTRNQKKILMKNQQLVEVATPSPSTSSTPRSQSKRRTPVRDSPPRTPTRSSLRLQQQKKPPSEPDSCP